MAKQPHAVVIGDIEVARRTCSEFSAHGFVVTHLLHPTDSEMRAALTQAVSHAIGESLLAGCPVLISDQTPWSFVGEQNAGIVLGSAECQDPDRIARQIDEIAAMTEADWRGMRLAARRCGEAGLVLPGTVTVAEALGYGLA